MTSVTWLHLSDWHQGSKEFDREVVRDKLLDDLENRKDISSDLAKVDFIIFSGDVANSAKLEEYQAAKEELIDPILKATGLTPDKLFIVPGNHDLDRDDLNDLPSELSKPLSSNSEIQKWLDDDRRRKILLGPFHAFSESITAITGQDNPDYAYVRMLPPIDGKEIALLGLNSAWMCGRHKDSKDRVDDERYVLVGEPQIHRSLRQISKADVRIAILHHPFEWLSKFDRDTIESRLMSETDFILRGHQHQPQVSVMTSTLGNCVLIPAGASYNRRNVDDLRYSNAYNFVHLDFNNGRCAVYMRCWSASLNRWREDIDSHPPNGIFDFTIPKYISAHADQADHSREDATDNLIKTPPSEASISLIPHQIPPPPADFTGRDDDIEYLLERFDQGATITGLRGMGGIGKTALAFKLAEKLIDRYPDGQILVNMNGTSDEPLTAADAMAQVIHAYETDARLPASESELSGLYRSKLHNKKVLILLDNAANDDQVRPLIPPSSCGLIVTSREKFTLPGLIEKDLNVLPSSDACALLLKIASRIGDHAEELAKLCGHLPLALRAASSLLANEHDLSMAEYLKELRNERTRLELIGGEGVDLDVEASFNLSYRRLKSDETRVFRLLSIFPSDFDANAEEFLCKDKGHKRLSKLVRWSLVDFYERSSRYRLHDLARIFAEKSLLKEDGDAARAAALHRYFIRYLAVLSKAHDLYEKGGDSVALGLEILDRELANIQAGQAWVEKNAKTNVNAAALCISYANSASILSLRLHPYNLISWLEVSLDAARRLNKPGYESFILSSIGSSYLHLGETRKAIEIHNKGLAISCEIGDRRGKGSHLGNLGNAYSHMGKPRKAIEFYEQALKIAREIGNQRGEGADLGNLGNAYSDLGEPRKAIEFYEQALKIARETGDRRGEGNRLGNLGLAYSDLGEPRKAIEFHEQALRISREIGDRWGEGADLDNLGMAYMHLGEPWKAIEFYELALKISREIGDRRGEGNALDNLGLAYSDLGEPRKAIEFHEQSLAIAQGIFDRQSESEILCNLGKAYLDLKETNKSIDYCTNSMNLARTIEYRKSEGEALCTLGKAFSAQCDLQKALDQCDQAIRIFKEIEYPKGDADAIFARSQALHQLGQHEEAIQCAQEALSIFQRIESHLAEKVLQQLAAWGSPQENWSEGDPPPEK